MSSKAKHLGKNASAVLVISSHVARGSVGNRAAVFALETLGHSVWAVPTIQLPWHPGHGSATRLVAKQEDFSSFIADIQNSLWAVEIGAVLTGYMANAEQVMVISGLIKSLKEKNPNVIHLCDPVIGDNGGLYVSEAIAKAIRDEFMPLCDIATPNCFELSWLTGQQQATNTTAIIRQARALGPAEVLVTSCPTPDQSQTGNLLLSNETRLLARHARFDSPPNGPVDRGG